MRLLVTGGVGYIGSHFCLAALESGHEILAIDNRVNESEALINGVQYFNIDIRDQDALNVFFSANKGIDAVIHFAALKNAPASIDCPLDYYENNVLGSINLLVAMQKENINHVVFSSTAAVYAPDAPQPCREDTHIAPITPYGKSKRMVEVILEDAANAHPEFRAVSLRYFNAAGVDESGTQSTHLLKDTDSSLFSAISKVLHKKTPYLSIYGNDYDTRDGTAIRDYIHVSDLADAHLKALEYMKNHKGAHVFNLGQGGGVTVHEVLDAFQTQGIDVPHQYEPRRAGDLESVYADITRATEQLGWTPRKDLQAIVRSLSISR